MPTKTSVGPKEVVRLEVLRLTPPLLAFVYVHVYLISFIFYLLSFIFYYFCLCSVSVFRVPNASSEQVRTGLQSRGRDRPSPDSPLSPQCPVPSGGASEAIFRDPAGGTGCGPRDRRGR
jgi:hypothetical protein